MFLVTEVEVYVAVHDGAKGLKLMCFGSGMNACESASCSTNVKHPSGACCTKWKNGIDISVFLGMVRGQGDGSLLSFFLPSFRHT